MLLWSYTCDCGNDRAESALPTLCRPQHRAFIAPAETALRAGFDALLERMSIVARIAAEADDMLMLRLLARSDVGVAVIPPIAVRDELASGMPFELFQLSDIAETFSVVTVACTFPNTVLRDVLDLTSPAAPALAP